ncbi:MAG: GNAT family N-acetyltransferase, partial [Spirochaetaceae bacterium]
NANTPEPAGSEAGTFFRETGGRIWLLSADQSRELVGCCAVVDEGNGRAQFRWFLTHPSVRGMGLGRALLTEAVAFARETGYREMFLLTGDFLPAAAHLYRDLGFRLLEERPFEGWDFSFVERTYSLDLSGE